MWIIAERVSNRDGIAERMQPTPGIVREDPQETFESGNPYRGSGILRRATIPRVRHSQTNEPR